MDEKKKKALEAAGYRFGNYDDFLKLTAAEKKQVEANVGRSKEMGKPVTELTKQELLQEKSRCENLIEVYGSGIAVKGLKKRLKEIEARMGREQVR